MVKINIGAAKEKANFISSMDNLENQEATLQAFALQIKQHIKNVEASSIEKRETISKIFGDIRQKIMDRE